MIGSMPGAVRSPANIIVVRFGWGLGGAMTNRVGKRPMWPKGLSVNSYSPFFA